MEKSVDPYQVIILDKLKSTHLSIRRMSVDFHSTLIASDDGIERSKRDDLSVKAETIELEVALREIGRKEIQEYQKMEELLGRMKKGEFKPLCLRCGTTITIEMFRAHPTDICPDCRAKQKSKCVRV